MFNPIGDHLAASIFPLIRYILFMDPGNVLLPNTFFTYIQDSTKISEVIWISYLFLLNRCNIYSLLHCCVFFDSLMFKLNIHIHSSSDYTVSYTLYNGHNFTVCILCSNQ